MRKALLLAAMLLCALPALAQNATITGSGIMREGSTLPTTCNPATTRDPDAQVLFYHTTTSGGAIGLYQCTASNTWTAVGSGSGGLSGMTAGQVPIAATASTVTSSKALAGSGAGIVTGPASGVTSGDVTEFTGTNGQIADTGTLFSTLVVNPMTTLGDSIYGGASGAVTRLAGPTAQNIPYTLIDTPSGGAAVAPAWALPGVTVNSVPCTSNAYTVLNSDRGALDYSSDASACAVTLPQAGSGNFTSSFFFGYANRGAGLATITPTPSTWNGNATQIVPDHWIAYGYSDNTNYYGGTFPDIAAFPSCPDSGGNHVNFTTATGAFSCGTSSSGGGGSVFPVTVSGTVTSGGIPCFNSTTNEQTSTALASGGVVLGGGAGACPTTSTQLTFSAPTLTVGLAGTSSGILALTGSTSGSVTLTAPAVAGTPTNALAISNAITTPSVATGTSPPTCTPGTSWALCGNEGTAPTGASNVDTLYPNSTSHCWDILNQTADMGCALAVLRATMTADWTCGTGGTVSSCASATIVGSTGTAMTITLPSAALSWDFDCDGVVGSATGDPANNWNLITATNAPTNTMASYSMGTAAAVGAFGATTGNSSTTTFNIGGTWTLGATGTKFPFHIHARIEGASASGTVVSLQIVDPTVGDLLTIYRGMSCWAHQ
jgi:hypothetical protein